jgi:hypothetical protein
MQSLSDKSDRQDHSSAGAQGNSGIALKPPPAQFRAGEAAQEEPLSEMEGKSIPAFNRQPAAAGKTTQRVIVEWGGKPVNTQTLTKEELENLASEVQFREKGMEVQTALQIALLEKDYKDDEEQVSTIREMFKAQFKGVKNKAVFDMIVEMNDKEITDMKKIGQLDFYLKNWRNYTSCFESSLKLFDLLGNKEVSNQSWGEDTVANHVPVLIADIEAYRAANSIYRVRIYRTNPESSDHSFAIVIKQEQAEVLQSFAGGDGESLGKNLTSGNAIPVADLIDHLRKLNDGNDDTRRAAELAMFNGRIDVDHDLAGEHIRDVRTFMMKIDRRPLLWEAELEQAVFEKLSSALAAYKAK